MRVSRTVLPQPSSRRNGRVGSSRSPQSDAAGVTIDMSRVLRWLQAYQDVGLLAIAMLAALTLLAAGQLLALLALLPLVLLLWERRRRRRWLRRVAERIEKREHIEKIEVDQDDWSGLARAVNGLLQEQQMLHYNAALQPASLPRSALAILRDEAFVEQSEPREVVVLTVGVGEQPNLAEVARSLRYLAEFAQFQAERHGALLLPCSLGLQLVFGAFGTSTINEALRGGFEAAREIAQAYVDRSAGQVTFGLSSGAVTMTIAPGLGFCPVGGVVEQALALQRLVPADSRALLVCGERDYLRLHPRITPLGQRLSASIRLPIPVHALYCLPL